MKPLAADRWSDMWRHERKLHASGWRTVAGIDEAGRGPLAGPVAAAAVIFPVGCEIPGIDDSKKLNPAQRQEAYEQIVAKADAWSVIFVHSGEIDRINILRATYAAMAQALVSLSVAPELVLVDGLRVPNLPCAAQISIVNGDANSASIAAASIIAKVSRDRLMLDFHLQYPEYGFCRHKGYSSAEHLKALSIHGPCPIHRRFFSPVAKCHKPASE